MSRYNIETAKSAGFCFGVKRAVEIAEKSSAPALSVSIVMLLPFLRHCKAEITVQYMSGRLIVSFLPGFLAKKAADENEWNPFI